MAASNPCACQLYSRKGQTENFVDTQTRHAMKHDALVDNAQSAVAWLEEHRSQAILFVGVLLAVLIIGIGSIMLYQHRQEQASTGFGAAMDIYSAPVAQPGTPAQPGVRTFPSSAARAQAANAEFEKVASTYGSTDAGKNALYFSGLCSMEMGETAAAEKTLNKVVRDGDKNLAALANLALVNLYRQTGKTSQAVQLLNQMASHPTTTVPASEAKLELAGIYESTNPQQARQIYAQIKDKDAKTAAGQIATQKLQQLK
jgi:predicted negative regulator of RcsB-dependent stress response